MNFDKSARMFVLPQDVDMREYLDYLAQQEAQGIHGVGHWWKQVVDRVAGVEKREGDVLPWMKTHGDFTLRPREVTIWAGYKRHMKSIATGQVAAWLARSVRVGIASFEMPPVDTIERMLFQAAGTVKPSLEFTDQWVTAMDPMIRIYDQHTALTPERVLAVVHHMAHNLGCGHVFIDSLMKCGIPTDDYTKQKVFVDELCSAAKRYDCHIHLIAHLKKPQSRNGGLPDCSDVSGGSDITNLADNVVIIWNDKDVMEAREKRRAGFPLDEAEQEKSERRSHIIKLDACRRDPDQICWMFWFDPYSLQFLPENRREPMEWLPPGKTMANMLNDAKLMASYDVEAA